MLEIRKSFSHDTLFHFENFPAYTKVERIAKMNLDSALIDVVPLLFLLYFKVYSRHHIILLINNLPSVTNKDFIKYSHNTIITPNKINSNFLISDSIFKKKKFCQSYTDTKERQ